MSDRAITEARVQELRDNTAEWLDRTIDSLGRLAAAIRTGDDSAAKVHMSDAHVTMMLVRDGWNMLSRMKGKQS